MPSLIAVLLLHVPDQLQGTVPEVGNEQAIQANGGGLCLVRHRIKLIVATQVLLHHPHAVRHGRVDALHIVLVAPLFQFVVPGVRLEGS